MIREDIEGLRVMLGSTLISELAASAISALYKIDRLIILGKAWIFFVGSHSLLVFEIRYSASPMI